MWSCLLTRSSGEAVSQGPQFLSMRPSFKGGLGFLTAWCCVPSWQVKAASVLRPGPWNWLSIINAIFYWSVQSHSPLRLEGVERLSKKLWPFLSATPFYYSARQVEPKLQLFVNFNERVWRKIKTNGMGKNGLEYETYCNKLCSALMYPSWLTFVLLYMLKNSKGCQVKAESAAKPLLIIPGRPDHGVWSCTS